MSLDPRAEAERRWPDYPHIGFSGPSDRQAAFIEGVEWARETAAEKLADDAQADRWALVDILARSIEDSHNEPHFTYAEHALMAAGEVEREWLAEHDRQVAEKAWDQGHAHGIAFQAGVARYDNPYRSAS